MKTLTEADVRAAAKQDKGRGPTLAQLAAFVNANMPGYTATATRGLYQASHKLYAHIASFGTLREVTYMRMESSRLAEGGRRRFDQNTGGDWYRVVQSAARWIVAELDQMERSR
jgi:hypothetical protein